MIPVTKTASASAHTLPVTHSVNRCVPAPPGLVLDLGSAHCGGKQSPPLPGPTLEMPRWVGTPGRRRMDNSSAM